MSTLIPRFTSCRLHGFLLAGGALKIPTKQVRGGFRLTVACRAQQDRSPHNDNVLAVKSGKMTPCFLFARRLYGEESPDKASALHSKRNTGICRAAMLEFERLESEHRPQHLISYLCVSIPRSQGRKYSCKLHLWQLSSSQHAHRAHIIASWACTDRL